MPLPLPDCFRKGRKTNLTNVTITKRKNRISITNQENFPIDIQDELTNYILKCNPSLSS